MEDSTQEEEDIVNLFQDDDPSSVIENIEFKFPISPVAHSLFLGGKGSIIGVRIH